MRQVLVVDYMNGDSEEIFDVSDPQDFLRLYKSLKDWSHTVAVYSAEISEQEFRAAVELGDGLA